MFSHWINTREMSLKDSFIGEMLNAEIAIKFASKVTDIIRNRYPALTDSDEWNPNDLCRVREFNKQIESGCQVYVTLKHLYVKEFDDIETVESAVKATADVVSDSMLVKFGWKKEEAKC